MTITIPTELEDRLSERAAREGLDGEALALGLLAVALAWEMPASEQEAATVGLALTEQLAEVQSLTDQMAQDRAAIAALKAQTRAIAAEAESIRVSLREMRLAAQRPRPLN